MLGRIGSDYTAKKHTGFSANSNFDKVFGAKPLTKGYETLRKKPVIEIAGLDIVTMIIPRTAIDSMQNLFYGAESFFREVTGMLCNPFLPGIISNRMTAKKGYKGLYADSSTIKTLSEAWQNSGGNEFVHDNPSAAKTNFKVVKNYVKTVLDNSEGLVGDREWKKLPEKQQNRLSRRLAAIILTDENKNRGKIVKLLEKSASEYTNASGAAGSIKVNIGSGINTDINKLLRDVIQVGKQVFTKNAPDKISKITDDLCKFSKKRTLLAVGATVIFGSCLQYVNRTITKMRTGNAEFCGYTNFGKHECENKENDKKSSNLLFNKIAATAVMAGIMLGSMGAFGEKGFFKKGGIKNLVQKLELKDRFAHLDVVKLTYGSVLMGRLVASRDNQELGATARRDYAGFLNWLVLGAFVSKGVAHITDKSLLNMSGPIKAESPLKTVANWINNVSLKTHSEVKAMTQNLSEPERLAKLAKLNAATSAGLLWSMFALGVGMPMLNNYLINKARKKQIEEQLKHGKDNINIQTAKNNEDYFAKKINFSERDNNKTANRAIPENNSLLIDKISFSEQNKVLFDDFFIFQTSKKPSASNL